MILDYFYTTPANINGSSVIIDGDEFAHMTRVMRKREGEMIRVVDGEGNAYDVQLTMVNKKTAVGTIKASYMHHNEPSCNVTLAVGLLKNPSRFDFLVEKVTELGVKEIVPLISSRTIPPHAKTERWQKLALSAMKQSCRSFLPEVTDSVKFDVLLNNERHYDRKIIFHEKATDHYQHNTGVLPSALNSILILIGPEGGFSNEEVDQCVQKGFSIYSLGERRLRTETAAIVAVALVLI